MTSGKLPPNETAGTRTSFALESDENWYFVQRLTGPPTKWLGYAQFLWVPAFVALEFTDNVGFLYATVAVQIFLFILLWIIYFRGIRRRKERLGAFALNTPHDQG
ncbi:SdpI family protein [Arcanobacterium phocisimile]|uniref:SdpI family protein n=2 Tax=Arcanobacterium TaxID=28263 RepID=A0ABX7II87_9ACTO|nr:SdpI family protein [Arcanobacterium phocisimile]QRV02701.1 SdpI family protein [Arcanobacterium phocisimile]